MNMEPNYNNIPDYVSQSLLFQQADIPDWLLEAVDAPPERLLGLCGRWLPAHIGGRQDCEFIAASLRSGYLDEARARMELNRRWRAKWMAAAQSIAANNDRRHANALHAITLLLNYINKTQ